MIKFFALIPRRKDLTAQEFHDHWGHPHCSMAPGMTMVRACVQSHRIDCPQLGPDQARYEGSAELWWPGLTAFKRGVAQAPELLKELMGRTAKSFASLYQAEQVL